MKISRLAAMVGPVVLLLLSGLAVFAQQRPTIKGVWRNTEIVYTGPNARTITAQPGLFIFTDRYYSITRVNRDTARPPLPPLDKATDKERADAFGAFTARAGTYETNGAELRTTFAVELNPNAMPAGFATFTFKTDGKTLELTQKAVTAGPVPNPATFKYVRVE